MKTKPIEQKIRARLSFDYEAMAEKYRSLDAGHPAWSESLGMEFGARWQHEKLTAELAPLLAEMAKSFDQALRQWEMYVTEAAQDDLKNIDHIEADELRKCKASLKKLEAWLGKKE